MLVKKALGENLESKFTSEILTTNVNLRNAFHKSQSVKIAKNSALFIKLYAELRKKNYEEILTFKRWKLSIYVRYKLLWHQMHHQLGICS